MKKDIYFDFLRVGVVDTPDTAFIVSWRLSSIVETMTLDERIKLDALARELSLVFRSALSRSMRKVLD